MMKNIKEITISIFAAIGFVAIITAFTNQPEQANQQTVPESHVWEIITAFETTGQERVYTLNKVTGEVRKYSRLAMTNGKLKNQYYQVLTENKEGDNK